MLSIFSIKTKEKGELTTMYDFDCEEFEEVTESCALEQAEIHLDRVLQNMLSKEVQDKDLLIAYLALLVAGKTYEANMVKKTAQLNDELERSMMALWILGARLELQPYKEQWIEDSRDNWVMMIVGSALQNIEELGD